MREFGFFLLAIGATLILLATIDPEASSPRQPPPASSPREPLAELSSS